MQSVGIQQSSDTAGSEHFPATLPPAGGRPSSSRSSTSRQAQQQQRGFSTSSSQLYQQPQSQLEQLPFRQSLQWQHRQGLEQHIQSPFHQAYGQFPSQVAPQKSGFGTQSQQQGNMGVAAPPSGRNEDMLQRNLKRQDIISNQVANQAQASTSKMFGHHSAQGDQQMELRQRVVSGQRSQFNGQSQPVAIGQSMVVNASRPIHALQDWPSTQNIGIDQLAAMSKQEVISHLPVTESSANRNALSDICGRLGSAHNRQRVPCVTSPTTENNVMISANDTNDTQIQQLAVHGWESQAPLESFVKPNQLMDHSLHPACTYNGPETSQVQLLTELQQLNPPPKSAVLSDDTGLGTCIQSQGGQVAQMALQHRGFTEQQLNVLKAQIFAFHDLKKKGHVSQELLRAIAPPPLESQVLQLLLSCPVASSKGPCLSEEVSFIGNEETTSSSVRAQKGTSKMKEPIRMGSFGKEEQRTILFSVNSEQEVEHQALPSESDFTLDKGKAIIPQNAVLDAIQVRKSAQASTLPQPIDLGASREYGGPIFDIPFFSQNIGSSSSSISVSSPSNVALAYDVKDLLFVEGREVLNWKRTENFKKIGNLLATNLDKKWIRPDLVLKLKIQEKKLRLLECQAHLRNEVDRQQLEIMAMSDRSYRKFVQLSEHQRLELARQVLLSQRVMREKHLKSFFQWRKKLLEAHWAIRDARIARNKGVAKYHERMLKDFSRRKDEDRNKRIEALKNNDVDRYREMLLEQQTSISGDAAKRYAILSAFLTETEEYLYKLGEKIVASKNQQEVEEAAYAAAADARLQGLSEQEIRAATACAREELMIRTRFFEMTAPKKSSYNSKYYDLAHAVNETVVKQPSMLRGGTLRNYQLVGLQWMLSLYNNKLNGVLADEMGLGKTVQVMALIAYLMEFKRNYGPHLIIVPNAVLVNWKSEFQNWLPSVSCIFYVGEKDQRSKLFSRDVIAMKFNVLVTTYEFVMHDRQKLSRVDWKYIIIDEAQRMKDRESVLARHLDRYHCQRRLLLTGTPLQNDLKELWSLLNLLLPEIFDNRKFFHDWFSRPFRKDGPTHTAEDDWLETETKVIIINRLHQILEPFMLRRRVEDVEGSLPPKVSVVLRCRMSALQGAIYDWIKSTGTLKLDPEDEMTKVQRNPIYQEKTCKALSNKCMELRKVCNHPLLNYPNFRDFSKDFVVRSCGKLWILDRILIKLKRTGHKVLLFSTMTKLLDILEKYLEWRQLVYKRIDGTTTLEDRESAIFHFNRPNSDCFIFLLSIRAAGRGLNLQSADTVVIYDPDPNPKNEEQAVARAHRIGQNREVKVIYMESVVDRISSHDKEDELRNGGSADLEHEISGTDRYMGSIESLIRSNIQQYKIEMADEVINAGRFDQTTTQEERRLTLEALLHDGERYQEIVHNVPSLQEVNRVIARSEEEVKLFDQMDEELDWTAEMTRHDQVPKWLRANSEEVNTTMAKFSKKSSRNTSLACYIGLEASEMVSDLSVKTENKRVQPKRSSRGKSTCIYREFDDENWDFYEASSQERSGYSMHEENGQTEEFEVEKSNGIVSAPSNNRKKLEEDDPICIGSCECPQELEGTRSHLISKEAGSSGSSPASQRLVRTMFPCIPSQKFGSLSSLDATSNSDSKRLPYELQEGENAVSGECHMDSQNFGSWFHDHIDGKDEQVSQPKIKRKRSIWGQPAHTAEKVGKNIIHGKPYIHCAETGDGAEDHKNKAQLSTKENFASIRVATSKLNVSPKPSSSNCMSAETGDGAEDATEHSLESWDVESLNISRPALFGMKMSDITQRKCKNVISKIERKIDKAGHQLVPLLADLWKRSENSFYMINMGGSHLLNFRKIYQRLDGKDYDGVIDFVADVQSMLDGIGEQFGFSSEVKSEIRKVHGMFSDIMKSTFPATDFHEARNVLPYPSPGSTSTQAPRQASVSQSKRQKLIKETEPKPSRPTQLLQHGLLSTNENAETQKESQLVSSSSSR